MEVADSSETPIRICQTTGCHVPDVSHFQDSTVKTSTLTDHIHVALVLRLFNAPCQYIPLLNLRPPRFRLNALWRAAALYYA